MDKKYSKKNQTGGNKASHGQMGIDWNLYEEMYAKTGFAKQFRKEDKKSSTTKVGTKTVQLKSRKPTTKDRKEVGDSKPVRVSSVNKSENSRNGKVDCKAGTVKRSDRSRRQAELSKAIKDGVCPVARQCGGCQYQATEYAEQLSLKQKKVQNLLSKFGKIDQIIGMKDPSHYRNKVHATFDRDRRGNYISGIYEEGTHEVVPIENCRIQNKQANDIINSIRGLLKSFKIKTYDEDSGYGLLRHVLIRTGFHSGEVMVVLVLGSPILPSKNNFVKALCKLHPEITTVLINVNNKKTSMILGDKETTIYGKGYIEDTLCGCSFRISAKSFYQVNPVQTEVLYNTAIELAALDGTQKVIDAYCGIGTIGLIASKHAREVIGVELNKDAVKDANANAKRNEIKNISFYNNDAGRFMLEMAEQNEHADVVIMNPPRAGSDETFMDCVARLNPKKVVYVSCNPETLARDLEYMEKKGYKVKRIVPVDMFPFTPHVETVVLLSKGEVDSKKIRVEFSLEDMDMSEFQDGEPTPRSKTMYWSVAG